MAGNITLKDLSFTPYLSEEQIRQRVQEMGQELKELYADRTPLFLVMLNGAFLFGSDLVRAFKGDAEISFVRARSYAGTASTHQVEMVVGPSAAEIQGRHIIIVEDIVDSGLTMSHFLPLLQSHQPASIFLATLLLKPDMLVNEIPIDMVGFEIPPKFVVGYGLDYDGLGRNLDCIYQLVSEEV
ncbi:MAG: hypoxanthine phosphoribosyltransferase [Saprospiraceae bacterium]